VPLPHGGEVVASIHMDTTSATRIVVVEDEPTLAGAVADRLRAHGYEVVVTHDGEAGLAACAEGVDLVVLDVMLPGIDGLEVCRRLRARGDVPVLLLTARDQPDDVVDGLAAGADDHLAKPFAMRVLVARVSALLRRAGAAVGAGEPVRLGDVELDAARRAVMRDGEPVHLTATEFDLLARLCERPGHVVRRDVLLAEVWGLPTGTSSRTVDTHVGSLRRKLGDDVVRTVQGVGYAAGAS